MYLVEVKNVRGSAKLEHHVVGNVDQRADRALAAALQALDHPGRCLRARVDAADDTT